MNYIDATGKKCPEPVIIAKNRLSSLLDDEIFTITVDNEIATQNLNKLAIAKNFIMKINKISNEKYDVSFMKNMDANAKSIESMENPESQQIQKFENSLLLLSSDVFGGGDDKLGTILMKTFLYALSEQETLPKSVVLINGGVRLAAAESPVLGELNALKSLGIEIFYCGLCCDYFGIMSSMVVGEVTNMYVIVDMLAKAGKVIKP